jgi:hypothetical protein
MRVEWVGGLGAGRGRRATGGQQKVAGPPYPPAPYPPAVRAETGFNSVNSAHREMVRDMKERLAYVAMDYEAEMAACRANPGSFTRKYELPDGQVGRGWGRSGGGGACVRGGVCLKPVCLWQSMLRRYWAPDPPHKLVTQPLLT